MNQFKQQDLVLFQRISADQNPIHQQGIVFGMQLLAFLEGELQRVVGFQEFSVLEYRFIKPLFCDQRIEIKVENHCFQVFAEGKQIGEGHFDGE